MLRLRARPSSAVHPIDLAIAKVSLAPGDTLLIASANWLTKEQVQQIRAHVDAALPGVEVMVLSGGLRATAVLSQG